MQGYERDLIKITHYINPHMFWYKYEDALLGNVQLAKWELKLNENLSNRRCMSSTCHAPELNEVVAVFHFSLNRWIRAKCIQTVEYMIANTKYIVWAIDYGIPFQTEARWITKLPNNIEWIPEETVFFGGISNIVPAEKEFNFETLQSETKPCSKWSTLAVRTIENLINEAAHIRFIRNLISKEGQFFGNLEFLTHTNQIIKADASLVEINHALKTNEFLRIIRQMKLNQIPKWKRNDGASYVSRYNVNKISYAERYPVSEVIAKSTYVEDNLIDEVSRKVSDWTKRNKQCQNDDMRNALSEVASICDSTDTIQISRKIATENLFVETDENNRDMSTTLKLESNLKNHSVKCKQAISSPLSGELSLLNKMLPLKAVVSPEVDMTHNKISKNKPKYRTCIRDVDASCSAMKLVMNRFNIKRRSLQTLQQQLKYPQNVIPAGFDLRNLQSTASLTNDSTSQNLFQ